MKLKEISKTCTAMLTIIAVLSSCSLVSLDEPGPTTPVDTPSSLPLTSDEFTLAISGAEAGRKWSALTFELEGLQGLQLCRLDDTFNFFSDGTYRYDGGEVLCGGEDDTRIKTGTWALDFTNTRIIFDVGTSKEYRATVGGLENGRMQLLGQVDIFGQSLDISGIYETEL